GDGTEESQRRAQSALEELWPYTNEMFEVDQVERALIEAGIAVDPAAIRPAWDQTIDNVLAEATLERPRDGYAQSGGRTGQHSEHLGFILAELQFLQRAYPNAKWLTRWSSRPSRRRCAPPPPQRQRARRTIATAPGLPLPRWSTRNFPCSRSPTSACCAK